MTPDEVKHYREMVEGIIDCGTCSKWEDSFCVSIIDQMDRDRPLTERQVEILTKIYEERT